MKTPRSRKAERARRIQAALIRMNINSDVLAAPSIGLNLMWKKLIPGGVPEVIATLRSSKDSTIVRFLKTYDAADKRDQAIVPIDAFALQAGVDIRKLLGASILALRQYSATEVKIRAITAHPEIARATIQNALKPNGCRDRLTIHKALGLLGPPGQTSRF